MLNPVGEGVIKVLHIKIFYVVVSLSSNFISVKALKSMKTIKLCDRPFFNAYRDNY